MKCLNCNQDIIVHDSIIPCKVSKPLTYDDKITRGMIYTIEGLKDYTKHHTCEVCKENI